MKRNISKIALVAMFAILGACSNGPDKGKEGGSTTPPTDAQIRADYIKAAKAAIEKNTNLKGYANMYASSVFTDPKDNVKVVTIFLSYEAASKAAGDLNGYFKTHVYKKDGKITFENDITTAQKTTATKLATQLEIGKIKLSGTGSSQTLQDSDIPNFSTYNTYTNATQVGNNANHVGALFAAFTKEAEAAKSMTLIETKYFDKTTENKGSQYVRGTAKNELVLEAATKEAIATTTHTLDVVAKATPQA